MRRIFFVAVLLVFSSIYAQEETVAPTLRSLQQARLETLRQRAEFTETQAKLGYRTYTQFADARLQMYKAELALAETRAQRVEVFSKIVESLRESEAHMRSLLSMSQDIEIDDVLKAAARRQFAEILLFREKSKLKSDSKDFGRFAISAWSEGNSESDNHKHGAYVIDSQSGMVWIIEGSELPTPIASVSQFRE